MTRAATTLADPCTGAPRRDFLLGLRRGQLVGAHVPSWCSRHGWTPVAPDELARLASLQLVATRRLRRIRGGRWLLPTSCPAWPAYSSSRPDASGGYRLDEPAHVGFSTGFGPSAFQDHEIGSAIPAVAAS